MDTFRQLGADPVNMNWGDAQTAFQQGVVDGQENPLGVLIPVKIHQYHSYATMWNYLVDPLVIYWNQKQWNAFANATAPVLEKWAVEIGTDLVDKARADMAR
jgi:TRAP-type C4-dicarboxylate transport system substrate-binding protein